MPSLTKSRLTLASIPAIPPQAARTGLFGVQTGRVREKEQKRGDKDNRSGENNRHDDKENQTATQRKADD
ncbi:hypothetical protein [Rhizobium bangladeshense]|uniref:hypothetical protein n=1 Tax=Rhizobium bangladeshense TaxID=1138189 RepID=UPI001C832C01|nr:hypothetical protein [Rhizobium bangladeshense]MBX4893566.1 hypothetical protein [Rhizobium bangladeshense]MBX4898916.1 hypothetical protein [Rhizobium bangladeshense]MBY3617012.1 hypothetical protein [Rhizobium bangladeshense]